jgi:hypothetical protein
MAVTVESAPRSGVFEPLFEPDPGLVKDFRESTEGEDRVG